MLPKPIKIVDPRDSSKKPSFRKFDNRIHIPKFLRLIAIEKFTIEFSLNDLPWIQRIQWIMTKSKSSMVTRGITHLATVTLPVLVIQSVFSLLPLGRYPLPITIPSRYQPTDSSGKLLYATISRNVTFVRCRMSLVTILLLLFGHDSLNSLNS